MNILEFAAENPLTACFLAYLAVEFTIKVIGRGYRTIMVSVRGWPPEHLDADGDWKPESST